MTIKREDLDRRAVDFSGVGTERRLPPVHPGVILQDDFLRRLGLSVYRLARALKIFAAAAKRHRAGTGRR